MNIFLIPSWYPSKDNPHSGIFNKEQAEALATTFPDSNFAISTWGQNEEDLLLWSKDQIRNLPKILKFFHKRAEINRLSHNLLEFYSPTLSWSRKLLKGNIKKIIKANEEHFCAFQKKKGKVDLIHAHTGHPAGWIAMSLSKKYKVPFIITEHMGPFPSKDYLTKPGKLSPWLAKPLLTSFCNIAVSPQQEKIMKSWSIPNLKYIPNLTNENFFRPAIQGTSTKGSFTFFTLARLEEGKGILYLLKAFKLLLTTQTMVCLRVGGDGLEKENLEQLAKQLNIDHNVVWLGTLTRTEALREYQQCNAFVLPSLYENLPLVLLEAIACGKPIISTYCGGPEEIINKNNGLLAEPKDSASLFKALSSMVNNISQYKEVEIRKDFCNRYSTKVVCEQIMAVYQELSSAKPK